MKNQPSIDEAAWQLGRHSAQQDLAVLATVLVQAAKLTPARCPESLHKESSRRTPGAAPADDPASSSSSSNSDDMSQAGGVRGVEGNNDPEPAHASLPKPLPGLNINVLLSKRHTWDGEDLKLEVFDRWYNLVQLYLRLYNVPQNIAGAGNYWIL